MHWFSTHDTIGIDISDHVIRAVRARRFRGRTHVTHFAETPLPKGAIVRGEIAEEVTVVQAIRQLLSKKFFIQSTGAVASLPESHAFLKTVVLPQNGILENEIAKHLPFPFAEVSLDTLRHGTVDQEGSPVSLVSFAALPSTIAQSYSDLMTHASVHVRALEVESQAIARLFVPQEKPSEVILLVDSGKNHTTVIVIEEGRIDITHSSLTITADNHAQLATEIERVLRFHREHGITSSSQKKAYTLLLTGGGSKIEGFQEELAKNLHLPVATATIPDTIIMPPELQKKSYSYSTAIGLALRDYFPL